jgi:hypothetical protein
MQTLPLGLVLNETLLSLSIQRVDEFADALGYNRPPLCSRTFISAMRCSAA